MAKRRGIKVSGKTKSELYFALKISEIMNKSKQKKKSKEKSKEVKKEVKVEKKSKFTVEKEDIVLVKKQITGWYGSMKNFSIKEIIYQIVLNKYLGVNYEKISNKLYDKYEVFIKKTLKELKE